ncbi:hypothetical protein [Cellulomonas pakistanensis]|uniref:hypothetical protein n=1 Tax=Cellulomonas pakistanensis TaxID=992287 RepID=UPI001942ECF5|nr:hypothetical protein [Cellulomonas pakistanensis]
MSAAEGRAAASDAPALGMHDPAGTPSAPRRRFRLGRRAVTALVLVGVLLVGGAGGFAIGRATAPGPAFPAFERGDGPGGRLPGGGGDGEMPQPPSGRSGSGSDPGSGDTGTDADPGSADAGTTDSSATT